MKNKSRIQICPQCGSPDIQTDFSNAGAIARGFMGVMKCNHCNHEGTFFPTVHITELKKPFNLKKAKNVRHFDKTFSRGLFKTTLFLLLIIFLMTGIIMFNNIETRNSSAYSFIGSVLCLIALLFTD